MSFFKRLTSVVKKVVRAAVDYNPTTLLVKPLTGVAPSEIIANNPIAALTGVAAVVTANPVLATSAVAQLAASSISQSAVSASRPRNMLAPTTYVAPNTDFSLPIGRDNFVNQDAAPPDQIMPAVSAPQPPTASGQSGTTLSTGTWLSIVGIAIALLFGLLSVFKRRA